MSSYLHCSKRSFVRIVHDEYTARYQINTDRSPSFLVYITLGAFGKTLSESDCADVACDGAGAPADLAI